MSDFLIQMPDKRIANLKKSILVRKVIFQLELASCNVMYSVWNSRHVSFPTLAPPDFCTINFLGEFDDISISIFEIKFYCVIIIAHECQESSNG